MSWSFRVLANATIALVCATAPWPAIAAVPSSPPSPVEITPSPAVDMAYFRQRLSDLGEWRPHPVWGEVWQPNAGGAFRPYFSGRWQFTGDRGWLWVSNEPYGDIVYHYGRWLFDLRQGWLWVPGYVWGPSWVAWRQTGGFIGWLPLPPGVSDISPSSRGSGTMARPTTDDLYGYRTIYGGNFQPDAFTGLWTFAPSPGFGAGGQRPYVTEADRVRDLYRRSYDATLMMHDRGRSRLAVPAIGSSGQDQPAAQRSLRMPAVPPPAIYPSTDGRYGSRTPPYGQASPQGGILAAPLPTLGRGGVRGMAAPSPPAIVNPGAPASSSIPVQAQATPALPSGPQSGAVLTAPQSQISSPPPTSGVPAGYIGRGGRLLGAVPARP